MAVDEDVMDLDNISEGDTGTYMVRLDLTKGESDGTCWAAIAPFDFGTSRLGRKKKYLMRCLWM